MVGMRGLKCLVTALLFGFVATFGVGASVHAQATYRIEGPKEKPTKPQMLKARDLFVRGTEDADAGRWSDALRSFEKAYRLSGIAAALFNAATTLRSLGRYRDARDAFDQMLVEHKGDIGDEMNAKASELREEVAARVATIEVQDLPKEPDMTLRLDGKLVEDNGKRPLLLEADPGRHNLRVERPGFEAFLWEGALGDGDRRSTRVVLKEIEIDDDSIFEHPVFWVVTGVVVVAGAGVGVYFGLKDADIIDPSGQADAVVRF